MIRQTISLDGPWQFQLDQTNKVTLKTFKADRTVSVPAPWQAHEGLHDASGTGWYQRTFKLSAKQIKDLAVIVHFGAVDYFAEVWVNGKKVGAHEGGYLPFEFDISKLVVVGDNTLTVRAEDRLDTSFAEVPHGKQSWYGPLSGIWQPVYVESRPLVHFTSLKLLPKGETITVEANLNKAPTKAATLTISVLDLKGKQVASTSVSLATSTAMVDVIVPSPKLWHPDTPNLYTVTATLLDIGDAPTARLNEDTITDTCGFRTIEAHDGKLILNGQPIYLRSALDQDYYPEGIYTPPSLEYIEDQFRKAKAMGLNSLRIHIKIGDPRYYIAADKIGLLIWTEMPNWQLLTEKTKERSDQTFIGMVNRDYNRCSIIIRSIINEAWGVDVYNPEHREWMANSYYWLKTLDPTRLVVDNSACSSNFHVVSDIDDMHVYYTVPDHYASFKDWASKFANRPVWTYTPLLQTGEERIKFLRGQWDADWAKPAPEVERRGDEPLIVSEFGNWGLPEVDKIRAAYGGKNPWWFRSGMQHGGGEVYPDGIDERFDLYHLNRAFPTLTDLSKASQNMEFVALKWELEEMRRHAPIQGYVITEFTDLHWECNGLLDMARNPKTFYKSIADINADDVILPESSRVALWEGETAEIQMAVSQYSGRDLSNSRIDWSVEGTSLGGTFDKVSPVQADVVKLRPIKFKVPNVSKSRRARLNMKLVTNGNNKVVAKNYIDLYFFPRSSAKPTTKAKVYAPAHGEALKKLGYTLVNKQEQADVVVTGHLTEELRQYLLQGGRVLWLAETDDAQQTPLAGYYGAHVAPRKGSPWSGDWASNFNWLNQDVLFKDIPTNGTVDFAFADLTPEHVIHGVHPYYYQTDVHSGLFLGWIQKAVALVSERNIGRGKLMISTYRLKDHLTKHPVADVLVRDLLARVAAM